MPHRFSSIPPRKNDAVSRHAACSHSRRDAARGFPFAEFRQRESLLLSRRTAVHEQSARQTNTAKDGHAALPPPVNAVGKHLKTAWPEDERSWRTGISSRSIPSAPFAAYGAEDTAVPEMQRPFVRKEQQVRDAIDSLRDACPAGYPIIRQNPDVRLKNGSRAVGKKSSSTDNSASQLL